MSFIYANGKELITKDDISLSNDLLKNAKWSKITYSHGQLQENDLRLGTQIIPINENLPVIVDFKPSNEQTNWDILSFPNISNNTSNFDDGWQSESKTWYTNYDWRTNTTRTGFKYIAVVLNNIGGADKVTCSLKVTQQENVIDYIKNNFDVLKSKLGG